MNYDTNDIEATIAKLQHQTKSYLDEIKKLVAEFNKSDKLNIISYFTYSLDISHDPTQESMCLGSYHIMNIGNKSITNPYLCIKISKESPFSLSGKYVYEDFKQSLKGPGGWQRINEKTNKEEFWLKPLGKSSIEPNEIMSFSNFQITWSSEKSYAGSIIGFVYSDQIEEGIAAVNPISLNGTILKQGDENE